MTLSAALTQLWHMVESVMNLSFPFYQYRISFLQMFIFATVGGILAGFYARMQEGNS
jgi:hypothetical protein